MFQNLVKHVFLPRCWAPESERFSQVADTASVSTKSIHPFSEAHTHLPLHAISSWTTILADALYSLTSIPAPLNNNAKLCQT